MPQPIDEAQVREIYRDTIDPLYRFVSRRCGGDRATAEDVTQETWMRAIRAWRLEGIPERPIAWLTTVARNLLLNQLRRRTHLSLEEVTLEPVAAGSASGQALEAEEVCAMMNQALDCLPARQSELLEAFHYDRRRVSELATVYGISERAVEGRLRRARESLRRVVEAAIHAEGERR